MTPTNPEDAKEPHFWSILIPWLMVIVLIGSVWFLLSGVQLTCHYSGDIMTSAAKASAKTAEEQKAGITMANPEDEMPEEPKKANKHQRTGLAPAQPMPQPVGATP